MFFRAKICALDAHRPAHTEMQAEEIVARKSEEHLFSARDRIDQARAGYLPNECPGVGSAEDSFARMQLHGQNFSA
jgi:hypothetical protein